jgi:hypothetical protein
MKSTYYKKEGWKRERGKAGEGKGMEDRWWKRKYFPYFYKMSTSASDQINTNFLLRFHNRITSEYSNNEHLFKIYEH